MAGTSPAMTERQRLLLPRLAAPPRCNARAALRSDRLDARRLAGEAEGHPLLVFALLAAVERAYRPVIAHDPRPDLARRALLVGEPVCSALPNRPLPRLSSSLRSSCSRQHIDRIMCGLRLEFR